MGATRADDAGLRQRMRAIAQERRRFGLGAWPGSVPIPSRPARSARLGRQPDPRPGMADGGNGRISESAFRPAHQRGEAEVSVFVPVSVRQATPSTADHSRIPWWAAEPRGGCAKIGTHGGGDYRLISSARARRGDPLTPFHGLDEPEHAFASRADERPKLIAFAHRLREHLLANRSAGDTNLLFSFWHLAYLTFRMSCVGFSAYPPSSSTK
jgi:hypothetical protein